MIFHSSVKYLGKTDGESTLRNAASFRDEGRLIRQSWRLIVRERWGVGVMYNIWQSAQRRTTHANGRSPCIWLDRWSLQCALCYGPSRLHLQSTPRPGSSVRRCLSIKLPWNFSAIASATLNLLSMQRVICDQKITLNDWWEASKSRKDIINRHDMERRAVSLQQLSFLYQTK